MNRPVATVTCFWVAPAYLIRPNAACNNHPGFMPVVFLRLCGLAWLCRRGQQALVPCHYLVVERHTVKEKTDWIGGEKRAAWNETPWINKGIEFAGKSTSTCRCERGRTKLAKDLFAWSVHGDSLRQAGGWESMPAFYSARHVTSSRLSFLLLFGSFVRGWDRMCKLLYISVIMRICSNVSV